MLDQGKPGTSLCCLKHESALKTRPMGDPTQENSARHVASMQANFKISFLCDTIIPVFKMFRDLLC